SFISTCTFFCSTGVSAGDTVSQTLPLMAHEDCVRNRASATCWYLPTRAAAAAYIEAVLECSCDGPVSVNSWKTKYALPGVTKSAMTLGRICSWSVLQCEQVKSPNRSIRNGAAGFPTLLPSGPAARQGSITASARANIFILLCYTKRFDAYVEWRGAMSQVRRRKQLRH